MTFHGGVVSSQILSALKCMWTWYVSRGFRFGRASVFWLKAVSQLIFVFWAISGFNQKSVRVVYWRFTRIQALKNNIANSQVQSAANLTDRRHFTLDKKWTDDSEQLRTGHRQSVASRASLSSWSINADSSRIHFLFLSSSPWRVQVPRRRKIFDF